MHLQSLSKYYEILKMMDKQNEVRQDMELQIAGLEEALPASGRKLSNTINNHYRNTKELMDNMDTKLDLLVDVTVDDAIKGKVLTLNKALVEVKKIKTLTNP